MECKRDTEEQMVALLPKGEAGTKAADLCWKCGVRGVAHRERLSQGQARHAWMTVRRVWSHTSLEAEQVLNQRMLQEFPARGRWDGQCVHRNRRRIPADFVPNVPHKPAVHGGHQ